jgi:hypothetical protein
VKLYLEDLPAGDRFTSGEYRMDARSPSHSRQDVAK